MRRIVISYAREDIQIARDLVDTLSRFGHQPWTDAGTHGGARWWDTILAQIRECDVLVVLISPAGLSSKACEAERLYARNLGKLLVPVMVTPTAPGALPVELAQIQFVDYMRRDGSVQLFEALNQLPPGRPLPHPLPHPPPPPLSYLNNIADRLQVLPQDFEQQHGIVTSLERGLSSADAEERATAHDLLQKFANHPNRLFEPAQRAQSILARTAVPAGADPPGGPLQGGPPPVQVPPRPRSKVVAVLAWIGGGVVALVLLAVLIRAFSSDGGTEPGGFVAPDVVRAAVLQGIPIQVPTAAPVQSLTCNSIEVRVGATTTCAVTRQDGVQGTILVEVTAVDSTGVTDFALSLP